MNTWFQSHWTIGPALALVSVIAPSIVVPSFPSGGLASQTANLFTTLTAPANFPVQFSIQYPTGWRVNSEAQNYIILTNYSQPTVRDGVAPVSAIKTDISLLPESLERIIQQNQQARREDDSQIIRRGRFKLAGRDGFRLWTTDSSFDFPDSIISYIRYDETRTIVIASFYTASNPNAIAIIQRIHSSFRF